MDILVFSILTNFVYYCSGYLFLSHSKITNNSNFFTFFIGAVIISFVGLLFNFFIPLSQLTNTLVYIIVIIVFLFKTKLKLNKNVSLFLIVSSLITFLLIIKSNVNRPDAGLYHLPYISILNENKIFFGLSNIHQRFAHVSIIQYLSAINNNYLFLNNGISIPLASIVSFFYIYFFFDVWATIKNKEQINIDKIFSLFILIYISFKITRYSSFGNDAVAHLSYFYLISLILKNNFKEININEILLISVFIFTNKPMLGIIFLIPLMVFLFKNKINLNKILNQIFSLPVLLLSIWLIKNIITSGCLIFPIKSSCVEKLPWTNIEQIINAQIEGEAWSKAWPDRIDKNISMEEFSKDFNWIIAWKQKHMKYMLKILFPYILILIIIFILIKKEKEKHLNLNYDNEDFKKRFGLVLLTSLIGLFSFFLIFPIYRYGYSYIISIISLIFVFLLKNSSKNKRNLYVFKFFIILSILAFLGKQSQKLYNNSQNSLWPNIYTFNSNVKNKVNSYQKIKMKDNFYYYYSNKGDNLCMYSKSPCTSYLVKKNIKHIKKLTYSIFLVE